MVLVLLLEWVEGEEKACCFGECSQETVQASREAALCYLDREEMNGGPGNAAGWRGLFLLSSTWCHPQPINF